MVGISRRTFQSSAVECFTRKHSPIFSYVHVRLLALMFHTILPCFVLFFLPQKCAHLIALVDLHGPVSASRKAEQAAQTYLLRGFLVEQLTLPKSIRKVSTKHRRVLVLVCAYKNYSALRSANRKGGVVLLPLAPPAPGPCISYTVQLLTVRYDRWMGYKELTAAQLRRVMLGCV